MDPIDKGIHAMNPQVYKIILAHQHRLSPPPSPRATPSPTYTQHA